MTDETAGIITSYQYGYLTDPRCSSTMGCEIETVANPYRSSAPNDPTTTSHGANNGDIWGK